MRSGRSTDVTGHGWLSSGGILCYLRWIMSASCLGFRSRHAERWHCGIAAEYRTTISIEIFGLLVIIKS